MALPLFPIFLALSVTLSSPVTASPQDRTASFGAVTADIATDVETDIAKDEDENLYKLEAYPAFARIASGTMQTYETQEEDTLLDIGRHFGMGYVEIRAANPDIDSWAPLPGTKVVIPAMHLLPRARQEGVVVNLSAMRLFYFETPGAEPVSFPIGIGKEGLDTPKGETMVTRKVKGPTWYPTERMREEKEYLPVSVPAGPANPLGTHALYLGWPTFLIHGSNKPWAIGRRVSSGCIRLYPEDISKLFAAVPPGTKVTVVDQPVLAGWVGQKLYLEAVPEAAQSLQIEVEENMTPRLLNDDIREMIVDTAGDAADRVDWRIVESVIKERKGYPVVIADLKASVTSGRQAPRFKTRR